MAQDIVREIASFFEPTVTAEAGQFKREQQYGNESYMYPLRIKLQLSPFASYEYTEVWRITDSYLDNRWIEHWDHGMLPEFCEETEVFSVPPLRIAKARKLYEQIEKIRKEHAARGNKKWWIYSANNNLREAL